MKKISKFAIVMAFVVLPVICFAAVFRTGDQPSVGAGEQITNDMYIAGSTVSSAGSITGDLVAAGGNIVISGNVGADVLAAGGNVSILSNVGDDIRVAGGTIVIQGKVASDVIAGGGQITLSGPGIGGDAAIAAGDLRIDAPIAGKLTVRGGNVFIDSTISGDVNIEAKTIELGSKAVISGNMIYKSSKELVKDQGAVVNGKVTFVPIAEKIFSGGALLGIFTGIILWKFFALLACALLLGLLFQGYGKELVNLSVKRPFYEIGKGLVFMAAVPVISILLFASVVGIPIGILGLLGFVAVLIFACITAPIITGSVAYRYFTKKELEVSWKTILLGVVLFMLIGIVPFIGWLVDAFILLVSLGCVVTLEIRILKEWR